MPIFPPDRYNFDSIYVLNNGWYIDFIDYEGSKLPLIKTPEGAEWEDWDIVGALPPDKVVDNIITYLSGELDDGDLFLQEIIKNIPLPPKSINNRCKIIGQVFDKVTNDPLENIEVKPRFIGYPPPPPSPPNNGATTDSIDEFQALQTDYTTEQFTLGAAIILDSVVTDESGKFIIEYSGNEGVDFSKSTLEIDGGDNYFGATKGPNIVKNGVEVITIDGEELPTAEYEYETTTLYKANGDREGAKVKVLNNLGYPPFELEYSIPSLTDIQIEEDVRFRMDNFGYAGDALNGEFVENFYPKSKETINTPQDGVNPLEVTINVDQYDLGFIKLQPLKIDLEEEKNEAKRKIQEEENVIFKVEGFADLGLENKALVLFNRFKEELKGVLLDKVIEIVSTFGIKVVHNFINGRSNPFDDMVCVPEEKIIEALRLRNALVNKLNNIYTTVRRIEKILKITEGIIFGVKIAIKIAEFAPAPPFTPVGKVASFLDKSDETVKKLSKIVNMLKVTSIAIGIALGYIINWLKGLDFMIQSCAEDLDIPFETLNKEINSFANPDKSEGGGSIGEVDNVDPLTDQPYPYKGFTFEIKLDISQNFQYPKKYAIARNIQGIQVLRSESSFGSNPQILIEELKFVIDRDSLRAD